MDSNLNIDGVISNAIEACEILGLRRGMAYALTMEHIAYIIPELLAVAQELKEQLDYKDAAIDNMAKGLYAKGQRIDELEAELDKLKIDNGLGISEDMRRLKQLEDKVQSIQDWQVLHISKRHESIDVILDDLRARV